MTVASEENEEEDEEEEEEKGFKEEKAFGSCSKANPFALETALVTPPALEIAEVISGDAARSPATAKGSKERAENPLLLFFLSAKTSAAAVAAAAGARNLSRAAKPAQPNARALRTSWSTQQELERRPPTSAMTSEGG